MKDKELVGEAGQKFSDPYSPSALDHQSRDDKEKRKMGFVSPMSIFPVWLTRLFPFQSPKSVLVKRRAESNGSPSIFQKFLPWLFGRPKTRFADMRPKKPVHLLRPPTYQGESAIPRSRIVDFQQIEMPITVRRSSLFPNEVTQRQRERILNSWSTPSPWIPLHMTSVPDKGDYSEPRTAWSNKVKLIREIGLSDSQFQLGTRREARKEWTPLAATSQSDGNEAKDERSFLKPGQNKGVFYHLSATTERPPRKYYTSQPWRNLYRDD